jgi:hypothetical protein
MNDAEILAELVKAKADGASRIFGTAIYRKVKGKWQYRILGARRLSWLPSITPPTTKQDRPIDEVIVKLQRKLSEVSNG